MRIFYAAGSSPNALLGRSSIWRSNLLASLRQLGHEVIEFEFDLEPFYLHADPRSVDFDAFVRQNGPILEAQLVGQVKATHAREPLDMFFSYFYGSFCKPETVRSIGALGMVTVNWYCNASYQFDLVSAIAPAYDYSLVPEKFRLADYKAIGANPLYCQEAANPTFYRPYPLPREYDITFVGAAYGNRPGYIRALFDAGLRVNVWGPRWSDVARPLAPSERIRRAVSQTKRKLRHSPLLPPRLPAEITGPPLGDEEMVQMFSRSAINLGFSAVGGTGLSDQPIRQVRLRDFEVPMAGGFYMLERLEEIEEFFIPDREIVCFEGPEELIEKARYYLQHEEERESIRQAGHQRALAEHTWEKRLSNAFGQMGL
jgi:spore maturation protein CgeB